ncbi:galactose oxidase [Aulographum hederae CBS 113979]|uniref:Galactose oxidase n=1 Tax=Aulographum hederae CBS 113979 TaxID=1176131 RepID=A0A6G1H6P1_9PEZI|nr:galactose oxidase [Aulographum hederae CBS 113979]
MAQHFSHDLSRPFPLATPTPLSAPIRQSDSASSTHTFLMPASPVKPRRNSSEGYKPKIVTTVGARPACLVNASATYVGNDQIYVFGGFDQYTDEVYNHVLRLNLNSRQWSLVDNYGDIPGVRMGHTANLWKGDKLLVYGGENEHRAYLSDVIIFDLKTAHWTQPDLNGPSPRGRARHSAVIHDDKLYIVGGMTGHDSYVLDDICYLDLNTWTWSRHWKFVPRYDHTSWIWNDRIWVFGGLGEDMERTSEVWWLDLMGNPAFESQMAFGTVQRQPSRYSRPVTQQAGVSTGSSGYAANSSSVHVQRPITVASPPQAPGSITSMKFLSGPELPTQTLGTHFHVYSSGYLLDFVTPASVISSFETSLSALDLDTLRWQKLASGKDLFHPNYRWHYCAMNDDGTHAWLLGCPNEPIVANAGTEEYLLSDVLPIDLTKLGLMGNNLTRESRANQDNSIPSSDANIASRLSGIGADLAKMFDVPPEQDSGTDFIVTAENDDTMDGADDMSPSQEPASPSRPIHVHRLILQARWPHFRRLYNAQMSEFHTKKLHIPEPYHAVRAFLYYLYTDSIAPHPTEGPTIADVTGMLVMSNIYDMPRLRALCVSRLGKELDVKHAAMIWDRANMAGEEWLKKRAANFVLTYFGRVVRTQAFKNLSKRTMIELFEEVDEDGRVVNGEELEAMGVLGGTRMSAKDLRSTSLGAGTDGAEEGEEMDETEDADMDIA